MSVSVLLPEGLDPEVSLAVLISELRSALVLVPVDQSMLGAVEALELLSAAVRSALGRAEGDQL